MTVQKWIVKIQEYNDGKILDIPVSAQSAEEAKSKVEHLLNSGFYCFINAKEVKEDEKVESID